MSLALFDVLNLLSSMFYKAIDNLGKAQKNGTETVSLEHCIY